ncbi:MAG TPA: DUF2157 domain-containing protein [Bacteroidia bacterium]|jgi:hypothetical protein|nr:DUF2157 domain-containing protein [Bacteroidia bacterium]
MTEDLHTAEKLLHDGTLSKESFLKIKAENSDRLFSVGFELRTLLSAGILLLTSGLGVLVYKNIDTIGHLVIILFIAAVSFSCLGYCYMKRQPYSNEKVVSTKILNDYILFLGCLTFVTFTGYLQYEYSVFGNFNGAAMLLPASLFFALAYLFDNLGILSMAITCLAAFVGITITPTELLQKNDFQSADIIYSGLAIGALLLAAAVILSNRNIKKHFKFTYFNFATHLLFVSCLAGMFCLDPWLAFTALLGLIVYFSLRHAKKDKSLYFLLFTVLYGYVGLTYLVFKMLFHIDSIAAIYLGFLYVITSSVLLILFLIFTGKKFRKNAVV